MENNKDVREAMTEFWEEHSKDASEQEMMLDSAASVLSRLEVPEILALLPDYSGQTVLEIGAGIGRFTSELAATAKHVTAVDFMESFVEKNKELHGHLKNIKFLCADATQVEFPENSMDLIFTNWLLMYMSDAEVEIFLQKALKWLRPGGHLYFRESCYYQSGDMKRSKNPSQYRDPLIYTAALQMAGVAGIEGRSSGAGYELQQCQPIDTYRTMKSNPDQICWLAQKIAVEKQVRTYKTFQEFLDKQQYSWTGILRYERIFGENFVSTGGLETTEEFVQRLDLQPGQRVLDVGSGIGGGSFYMAEAKGVDVVGIDLSFNMVHIAWQRAKSKKLKNVKMLVADAMKVNLPAGSFDVVYSRDTILHIPDKTALFTRFYDWLKPGGKLLISDYCCSEGEHSPEFTEYVQQRQYTLLSAAQYGQVLEQVGFIKVNAQDKTDLFREILQKELARTKNMKDDFVQEFSQTDYDAIVSGWSDKLVRTSQGDQRWGLFYAEKPTQ